MVALDAVRSSNVALVQRQPIVGVFFGGTGGIGNQTLRALAAANGKASGARDLRAYIIGRNAASAEKLIVECSAECPQGNFMFIKAEDMSLLSEIDRLCGEVEGREEVYGDGAKIDYLMIGQGGMPYVPRKDTKEGLDSTMSLMYYSRMRVITSLLPLLLAATTSATVVSVYAAGMERELFIDDLSLRDLKTYKYDRARSHMTYFHTLFFEELAAKYPGKLSLIHVFPGLVPGPGFHSKELPLWFRVVFNTLVTLFGRWICVDPGECGERMVSLAAGQYPPGSNAVLKVGSGTQDGQAAIMGTDEKLGSGMYSLTWNGESNYPAGKYADKDKGQLRTLVWKHTMKAFEVIEKGGVFTE